MKLIRFLILLLGLLTARESRAQKEFDNWCFGSSPIFGPTRAGCLLLSFGSGRPVATDYPHDFRAWKETNSAGATISDASGRLLFSCDGNALFDADGRLMPGSSLNTISSADLWWVGITWQDALIVPSPGRPNCYHVFHWNKAADPLRGVALAYVVVDMRLNAGRGGLVERGTPIAYTATPRMAAVRHANNRDFWILTRDEDTRGFVALGLAPRGLNPTPVVSLAGQALYPHFADLQVAPDGRHLATDGVTVQSQTTTLPGTAQSGVCLYDFDNATGIVSHERVLRLVPLPGYRVDGRGRPIPNNIVLYGSSFSPNGTKLYTTESSPFPVLQNSRRVTDIWQYDLTRPTTVGISASRFLVSNVPTPPPSAVDTTIFPVQLQLTPTGEVWTPRFDSFVQFNAATGQNTSCYSAIIRHPDAPGAGCGFSRRGFMYAPGRFLALFPNLITNMLYAPAALNHEAGCPEDSVQFWASSAGNPAGLRWDFGEPASGAANQAAGPRAAHRYQRGGTYPVRLTLADGRVLTQAVTVAAGAADFTNANVFTPNNDGQNDEFSPVRTPLPGGRLRVFSRWGPPVFSTTEPALRWDGTGAAAGTYFYELEYPDCRGTARQRRGTLLLVR